MTIDYDSLRECLHNAELIVCDPPWRYGRDASTNGWRSSARRFYAALTEEELCSMRVGDYCANDAVLLMWSTAKHIPSALAIMNAWGFDYRTIFQVWCKTTNAGQPLFGLGLYSRSSTEYLLLGIKGKVKRLLSPTARDVSGKIFARRGRHSAKPIEAFERINHRFTARKKVELFARDQTSGWLCWGDQLVESEE
jgi:N6-adenosine-specific RNA methylase IME4